MDVKRRDTTPFLRRDEGAGNTTGTVAKGALPKVLVQPEAATAKPVVARDSFERVGSNLFASVLSPRPLGSAGAPETASRSRTIEGAAARFDGALETFIGQAAALLGGDTGSQVGALRERLEQLNAERKAVRGAITEVIAQIQKLEVEAAQKAADADSGLPSPFGSDAPPTDPKLLDLQRTLQQLQARLGAVDVQIKEILHQIETLRAAESAESGVLRTAVDPVRQAIERAASTLQDLRNAVSPDP